VAGEMKKNLLEIRYISRKTVAIQNQFKETHVTLIEDEVDANRYTAKVRLKGSQNQQLRKHELWIIKNSIQEMQQSELTTATIESHLVN
jgi:hypothetical protein